MTVQRVWTPEHGETEVEGVGYEPYGRLRRDGRVVDPRPLADLLRAGLLCNDSRMTPGVDGWTVSGDPTEGALIVLAAKAGLRPEQEIAHAPRLAEIPFDSVRKRMTTVHLVDGGRMAYVKGAAGEVVPRCVQSPQDARAALAAAERMERSALRVLAVARRRLPQDPP